LNWAVSLAPARQRFLAAVENWHFTPGEARYLGVKLLREVLCPYPRRLLDVRLVRILRFLSGSNSFRIDSCTAKIDEHNTEPRAREFM